MASVDRFAAPVTDPPAPAPPQFVTGGDGRFEKVLRDKRLWEAAAAIVAGIVAIKMADYCGVTGVAAVDDAAKPLIVCLLLFGLAGFGPVRLLLPKDLRQHELLWIVPTGACVIAVAMTVLGFAKIPYAINLTVVTAGCAALSLYAWRRAGLPERPPSWRAILWPAWIASLLICIVLIPLFRSGFATIVGQGQDAHMAAGTAEFLKHASPKDVDIKLPIDREWPTWKSKQAIYYATAAISTYTGMQTYEVLSAIAALMLALATIGFYLVGREMFGAGIGLAVLAMALAGLDRMALHTAMHPYFNQIWGYMTTPFGLVLAWRFVREPSRGTGILLLGILGVDFFAYPLAGPLVLYTMAVFWWVQRRAKQKEGDVPAIKDQLKRGWRYVRSQPKKVQIPVWFAVFFLLVPIWGAFEKLTGGSQVLINPHYSLSLWGGDLDSWFPEPWFFGLPDKPGWPIGVLLIVGLAFWSLKDLPRPLAWGLGALLGASALVVLEMRLRQYGWYFHFKVLAFAGPLCAVMAVSAAWKLKLPRWIVVIALFSWLGFALNQARNEAASTFDELPKTTLALRGWAASLPQGASVRLDIQSEFQNWPAYMMAARPLCSQRPLLDTAYPHVQISRKADYVVSDATAPKPYDAIGAPLKRNAGYVLYKLSPNIPGPSKCSQEMVQTVTKIDLQ